MCQKKLYIEKELSWLSFNERVLQEEAADKSNPLIERMRFLGIYFNNLDEFDKVRFAELKRRILISEEQDTQGAPHAIGLIVSRPRCLTPSRNLIIFTTTCCWRWPAIRSFSSTNANCLPASKNGCVSILNNSGANILRPF